MEELKIGDQVQVKGTPLEFEILGFTTIAGQKMAESTYGDFNIDLLEKLNIDLDERKDN